jgi:hypothetical protein
VVYIVQALEDEEDEELDELEDDNLSVHSASRLTARQAAIVTGLETEHVELGRGARSRRLADLPFTVADMDGISIST